MIHGASAKPVSGDPELFRRAVENVIRNAIKYSPRGKPIEVTLEQNSDETRLAVRDYGPGVPDDMLTRIFEPFFRVDETRDAATGGVGLGLAIARRAVSEHHGRLDAKNANPGLLITIAIPA